MKAHALYHLMQLRARKLNEHLPDSSKVLVEEIQSSIKIQRQPGTYTLDWNVNQKDYSVTMESDPFKFYEKGDNAKRNAKRTGNLNYRTHNWDAALALWRDIFRVSNLDPELIVDDGKLAFGKFGKNKTDTSLYQNLGVALLFSLLSSLNYSLIETSQLFITISVLLFFADSFASVHIRKSLNIVEKLIIAAGCLIPLYYGVNLIGGIFVTTGLYLLCAGEQQGNYKQILFSASGAAFGLATYSMNGFAFTLAVAVMVLLIIISIIDSQRISKSSTGLFIAGFIAAWLGTYAAIETGNITSYIPQELILNQQYMNWIATVSLTMLVLGCAMWWIIGVQFYLLPWLSLFAIFIAALLVLFLDRNDVLVMLGIFLGFNLFVFERVLAGFFINTHGSERI